MDDANDAQMPWKGWMDAQMMQMMPPEAMGGMDAPMMEMMPPEAMQGVTADDGRWKRWLVWMLR